MSYKDVIIADAPISYWRLEIATAYNEISGTTTAKVGTPTVEGGIIGSGWKFNRTQVINLTGHTNFKADNTFSIETWFRIANTAARTGWPTIYWASGGGGTVAIQVSNANGELAPYFGGQTAYFGSFDDDKWHHLVITVNGTGAGAVSIYVDNVLLGTLNNPGSLSSGATAHVIGAIDTTPTEADGAWDGYLDEFAIYDYALTPTQVATHYNAGYAYVNQVLSDSPLYLFELNEASGTTANNTGSQNAYDGTLMGTGTLLNQPGYAGMKAASLDGNGYINIPTTAPNFSTNNATFTYEAWVKFDAPGAIEYPTVIRRDGNGIATIIRGRGPNLATAPSIMEGYVSPSGNPYGTSNPYDSQWKHVVLTKSAAITRLYVNGVLEKTATTGASTSFTFLAGSQSFTIGGVTANERFKGLIVAPAIYSTALDQARITAHYNAGFAIGAEVVVNGFFRGWGVPAY